MNQEEKAKRLADVLLIELKQIEKEEKGVIDVFKDGAGREKFLEIQVNEKKIGTIHLGDRMHVGDPRRIIIDIDPEFYGSGYSILDGLRPEEQKERNQVHLILLKK